ncbi:MAG: hypothetical protein RJB38_2276 [Pseudomonadota bacterium]|jgi:hypothetical protein
MSQDKALRKKQRAALIAIREACLYRETLLLYDGQSHTPVTACELHEKSPRDLEELRHLLIEHPTSSTPAAGLSPARRLALTLNLQGENFSIPIEELSQKSSGETALGFRIDTLFSSNRRQLKREMAREGFFVPIQIVFKTRDSYPLSGLARVIDHDPQAIAFEVRLAASAQEKDFFEATLFFQEQTITHTRRFEMHIIRNLRQRTHQGKPLTTFIAVSRVHSDHETQRSEPSLLTVRDDYRTRFKIFLNATMQLDVFIQKLTLDGFTARVTESALPELPRFFLAEHLDTGTRFQATKQGHTIHFHRSSKSIGTKVQWYNHLTQQLLGFEYRFRPKDVREITRLILETGSYSQRHLSDLTQLHGYLQYKWPIEEALSKTKYRWVVRNSDGALIGHTSGVRVSEVLWAAIDNVGSQSYEGSWNREYVARWLKIFIELLQGEPTKPLVQWTFNPKAGVWNAFDRALLDHTEWVYASDRFWITSILSSLDNQLIQRCAFEAEKLENPVSLGCTWLRELGLEDNQFLRCLYQGTQSGSTFCADFEHDYAQPYSRHFYLIKKNQKPCFLLTFTNYPDWCSFNKGHDFHYLFPLEAEPSLSEIDEAELMALARETIFNEGCTPFKLALVSQTLKLSQGLELKNLILKPEALHLAIRGLEDS